MNERIGSLRGETYLAKSIKVMSWQDAYYDGKIDPVYEDFCEETQRVVKRGWRECGDNGRLRHEQQREEEIDNYYIRLMRGEIQRIL
jgi:hypothetical protein